MFLKISQNSQENACARNSFLIKLQDSWSYMPPILVPSSAKRIARQMLVIAKLRRKDLVVRGCVYDMNFHSKQLPVQS